MSQDFSMCHEELQDLCRKTQKCKYNKEFYVTDTSSVRLYQTDIPSLVIL